MIQATRSMIAPATISKPPPMRGMVTVSFSTRIDMSMTKRILVSRSAATAAMGALDIAQMTIQ